MASKALEEGGWKAIPTLANVDPPQHTRVRKLANTAFTPRRVAEMEPFIRSLVVKFCDTRFQGGTADLVHELAWDLPVLVLFKILGVPDDDVERIKTGSWNRILFIYGRPDDDEQVRAAQGMAAFWRYAEELVASRLQKPENDFTSALAHALDPDGMALTPQQTTTVILNLLFAGHETTTGLLGNAFRRLLADRQAWQEIVDDPGLIPNAVEEILRLDSSVIAWRRHTTADVDVGGVQIPAHSNLLLMLGSGNRDPAVFPDPDRLDIRRPNARENLSFGVGAHLCLGARWHACRRRSRSRFYRAGYEICVSLKTSRFSLRPMSPSGDRSRCMSRGTPDRLVFLKTLCSIGGNRENKAFRSGRAGDIDRDSSGRRWSGQDRLRQHVQRPERCIGQR